MNPPTAAVTAPLASASTTPANEPAYRRILVKLSGEALMGEASYGIERETIDRIVHEIADVLREGVQFAVAQRGHALLDVRSADAHFFQLRAHVGAIQLSADGCQVRVAIRGDERPGVDDGGLRRAHEAHVDEGHG